MSISNLLNLESVSSSKKRGVTGDFIFNEPNPSHNLSFMTWSEKMTLIPANLTQELVINWHITEACNYRCHYCYAKWQYTKNNKELIHCDTSTEQLLQYLQYYFNPNNPTNPLLSDFSWKSVRLNLAGGEPLLYLDKTIRAIKLAHKLGFGVSIITNGSRLDEDLVTELAPFLSILGLSIDSQNDAINRTIGRVDRHLQILSHSRLNGLVTTAKKANPQLKIKINTVINSLNYHEDMSGFIFGLAPDKWKVLRMLPTLSNSLAISDSEFSSFVNRHRTLEHVMCIENHEDMSGSYIMIDPHGRFFQNSLTSKGYKYSDPILEIGVNKAFSQISLSTQKFCKRYKRH